MTGLCDLVNIVLCLAGFIGGSLDTPTHGLIGRLVARSLWPEKTQTGLVRVVTVCSLLPDLDVLFPGEGLEGLVTHRGMSHSLLGVVVGAGVVAGLVHWMALRHHRFCRVYLASFLGLLLHVFFDVVTSYGTVIFAPFSNYRASLDLWFIIDPYLDAILIASLLVGWLTRFKKQGYRLGTGLLVFYLLLAVVVTGVGHGQVRDWAKTQGITVDRVVVMPTPFSPLHRRGMVVCGDRVYWMPMSLFGGVYGDAVVYDSALSDARLQTLWPLRAGEIYGWFARVPVVRSLTANTLLVQDLQFVVLSEGFGWLGAWVARLAVDHWPSVFDRRNFALEVQLDAQQRILHIFYFDQNGERHAL